MAVAATAVLPPRTEAVAAVTGPVLPTSLPDKVEISLMAQAGVPHLPASSTQMLTANQVAAAVVLLVALAMDSGRTASTSPVPPTPVLSVSSTVSPTTLRSNRPVSTLRSTMTSLSMPLVKVSPSLLPDSQTLLVTSTC